VAQVAMVPVKMAPAEDIPAVPVRAEATAAPEDPAATTAVRVRTPEVPAKAGPAVIPTGPAGPVVALKGPATVDRAAPAPVEPAPEDRVATALGLRGRGVRARVPTARVRVPVARVRVPVARALVPVGTPAAPGPAAPVDPRVVPVAAVPDLAPAVAPAGVRAVGQVAVPAVVRAVGPAVGPAVGRVVVRAAVRVVVPAVVRAVVRVAETEPAPRIGWS
jgi:hypothetical protein